MSHGLYYFELANGEGWPEPIPDCRTVMLPSLKLAAYGNEHAVKGAMEHVAAAFGLPDQEQTELSLIGISW